MKKLSTLMLVLFSTLTIYGQTDCSELYFSEYIEGTSDNKALEIFNPTKSPIDLASYSVALYANGKTSPYSVLNLKGKLASGSTYNIANSSADKALKDLADTIHSVTNFNGNDVLVLGKYNGANFDTLDIIGVYGVDPGKNWKVGKGATSENTLVRMAKVKSGTTRWKKSATQWDVYNQDEFSYFGSHTADCMSVVPETPKVNFNSATYSIEEGDSSFYAFVAIDTVAPSTIVEVEVRAVDGLAMNGTDYTFTTKTITFTDTDWKDSVLINIVDNNIYKGDLDFSLVLAVKSGDAEAGLDTATVTIIEDEFPLVSIRDLRQNDADEVSVWNGQKVWTGGIVNNANSFSVALMYVGMQTRGWGISTYFKSKNYSPQVGDSIIVLGIITDNNGLLQITQADSLALISKGNAVAPEVVTQLNEETESKLVTIENVWLVDAAQWKTSGNFTVELSDGINTFQMLIDADTDINGHAAPTKPFTLTGIGGQLDNTLPRTSGYQILPRNWLDFHLSEYSLTIKELRTNDANGVPIYNGRKIRTSGIVNTDVSFNDNGLQISIQDGDWGVSLFGAKTNYGYTNFAIGDNIEVVGTLMNINGLTVMDFIDTIIVHKTGESVSPDLVNTMSEITESKLVIIKDLSLIDINQWKTSGAFEVAVTNGTYTFTLAISNATDIPGLAAPTTTFDLIGIGGQNDENAPYNSGYQVLPRSRIDIMVHVSVPNESAKQQTAMYPSPTSGLVYTKTNEALEIVNVYTLAGSKLKTFDMLLDIIDLTELNDGVYIIEAITINGEVFTQRIIKH